MSMQIFRKHQKWLMAGLAVFLAAVWGAGIGKRGPSSGGGNSGKTYGRVYGRKVTVGEFRELMASLNRGWISSGGLPTETGRQREIVGRVHLAAMHEVEQAGVKVSDEEVAEALRRATTLRRSEVVECVLAAHSNYTDSVSVSDEDIETYYNEHKEDFKKVDSDGDEPEYEPLDEVRSRVERGG